jgi:drug/metabolite transporter (DMT)-like permease
MRLVVLVAGTMAAFAANSVLNRMAVGSGAIDPVDFAVVRLAAGAAMLALLVGLRLVFQGRAVWPGWRGRVSGVGGLLLYLFAFSLAYVELEAGIGALILFGLVQITMFAGALWSAERVPAARWAGAVLAFAGLVVLVSPFGQAVPLWPAVLMALAGVGWGIYSLAGRGTADALAATAANFCLALPLALPLVLWRGDLAAAGGQGIGLAVAAGAVTSGLGYALWYALVPRLGAARAGVAQLTVPVLAAFGGAVVLQEPLTLRFAIAAVLVLGGVGLATLIGGRVRRG